jgi:hypothetical protein
MALITGLLLVLSLMALGSFAINTTVVHQDISANLKATKQEFFLAEAGLQHAQWFLANNINKWASYNYATATPLLDSVSCRRLALNQDHTPKVTDCATAPLATDMVIGTYTVTIQNAGGVGGGSRRVLSTGSISSQGQTVLEALFGNNASYPCVICSKGNVTLTGTSTTDSFDSTLGAYASQPQGNEGSVDADGNVVLNGGGVVVHGNAAAGGTVSGSGTVTGASTNGAPLQYFPPVVACGSYSSGSGISISGGSASYNATTGDLTSAGSGKATVTLASGTYCLHSVQLNAQSVLQVNITGGPVRLYLTADSNLGGQAIENDTGAAENFQIFSSLASATQGITLAGGPAAAVAVYAPNAQVQLSGGSNLYGSIVGGSVTLNGNTNFHYDKALTHLPNAGLGLVAWRQVF